MFRAALMNLCLLALLLAPMAARPRVPAPTVETDYILALYADNHFLHAWQTNDQETGILMLSDRLKHKTAEDTLQTLFSSAVDSPQSFEIGRGKRLGPGRYKFPVALFLKSATTKKWTQPRPSALIVVKAGSNDWAIDKLP